MKEIVVRIHPEDNAAVAVESLTAGQKLRVGGLEIAVAENIPAGHKVALADIPTGREVVKYGFQIGRASMDIPKGAWVHSMNLSTSLSGLGDFAYEPRPALRAGGEGGSFQGYLRENGDAGIRNEIWIINTVGCVNKSAERIAAAAMSAPHAGIDGVFSFSHPFGCSQLGDDLANTQKILAGLAGNPNAGAVLVLGLGCENNHIGVFRKALGQYDRDRVLFLNAQGVEDEVAEGVKLIERLANFSGRYRRSSVPLAKLKVGLKCGGSDAFSGITANPLLGRFSDRLVGLGGSVIMTEVPEMFGAEKALLARCRDRAVFDRAVGMINGFRQYYLRHGQPIYDNPSPGNKEGGITTLEEKSLGCVQKGGTAEITDILEYGQAAKEPGLSLLWGPGNDMVACTALAASGAQLILFTTGRGTPLGGPVPTVKVSTTSGLCRRKNGWIDFDAGRLLQGEAMDALSSELFDFTIGISEKKILTRNEQNGYREISILKDGVYL
jgi:altronate hydrolase